MELKVPGGKLARLTIRNKQVMLSGDFFIYPEEGIVAIERTLSGLCGNEPVEFVEEVLMDTIATDGLQLVGLDVPVIARLYKGAIHVESPGP